MCQLLVGVVARCSFRLRRYAANIKAMCTLSSSPLPHVNNSFIHGAIKATAKEKNAENADNYGKHCHWILLKLIEQTNRRTTTITTTTTTTMNKNNTADTRVSREFTPANNAPLTMTTPTTTIAMFSSTSQLKKTFANTKPSQSSQTLCSPEHRVVCLLTPSAPLPPPTTTTASDKIDRYDLFINANVTQLFKI